ncbi:MAG TPA: FAD-binding oxidoreductase [Thermoanaerobaculia bacterium]|nr:FAD-binding oxidoreductase [Thermoanaerobaculia bacterium]
MTGRRTADVAIIGAGVIGASIAWHLAQRGCTNVLVLDRGDAAGAGSTARATGGFRAQFGSEVNVRLSLLSREKLLRFTEETHGDAGFRQDGYLFIAGSEDELRILSEANTLQQLSGLVEARIIEESEVRRINPAIAETEMIGGVFCPTDGFLSPMGILRGYLDDASRMGVRTCFGEEIQQFEIDDGSRRIAGLTTNKGAISASIFVNAAGAWAADVARLAGIALPVVPLRRQVAVTAPTDLLPEAMPMTIFTVDGFHLRVRDGRVLLLLPQPPSAEPVMLRGKPFDADPDGRWLAEVVRLAAERIPRLANVPVRKQDGWSGLYEMTPDHHAILGLSEEGSNLFLANGSSGHGVMHSPAIGQILAEMILDGRSSFDARALRPSRFVEGKPNESPVLL